MPIESPTETIKAIASQLELECRPLLNQYYLNNGIEQHQNLDHINVNYAINNVLQEINVQLNLFSKYLGMELFFRDRIEKFVNNLQHTDSLSSQSVINNHDSLKKYLLAINRLLQTYTITTGGHALLKLLDKLELPTMAVYEYIISLYAELHSACLGGIYKSVSQLRKGLIQTLIKSHIKAEHPLLEEERYFFAYQSCLDGTKWEIDILDEFKPLNFNNLSISSANLIDLFEKLNKEVILGNIIKTLAEKIYNDILSILEQDSKNVPDANVMTFKKFNNVNMFLRENYSFIDFKDCITHDSTYQEYVLEDPVFFYRLLAEKLFDFDFSETHFKTNILFDTATHSIQSIGGLYWVENKEKRATQSLTLSALVQARITGFLDNEMLLYATHNSPIAMIDEFFDPSWVRDIDCVLYDIISPKNTFNRF
ncbi:hypothetical protein ABK905_22630 [Acerihabitans sp. KWT182]|uniref:Uncharacterized protein n=1 Tax=Acerihabitans sp. KWT182 TaxID=3157919 RepID=A0AAU7Q842_9GAMM